jgi:hypothetical protein
MVHKVLLSGFYGKGQGVLSLMQKKLICIRIHFPVWFSTLKVASSLPLSQWKSFYTFWGAPVLPICFDFWTVCEQ